MADESPAEGISLKYPKNIFVVHVILYAPKQIFFNILNLSAIAIHVKYIFPYCFYTHLQLERLISLFILIFFYIFLCRNF